VRRVVVPPSLHRRKRGRRRGWTRPRDVGGATEEEDRRKERQEGGHVGDVDGVLLGHLWTRGGCGRGKGGKEGGRVREWGGKLDDHDDGKNLTRRTR